MKYYMNRPIENIDILINDKNIYEIPKGLDKNEAPVAE